MTDPARPIVNPAELELEHWQEGSFFESEGHVLWRPARPQGSRHRLRRGAAGQVRLSVPQSPYRGRAFRDRQRKGEYRFGSERYPVKSGDVLGAPAGGPETAHHLINTGTVPLKYLSISTNAKAEIVEYPDSGKFLAKSAFPPARRRRASASSGGGRRNWIIGTGSPESDGIACNQRFSAGPKTNMHVPTIETDRLILRPYRRDDFRPPIARCLPIPRSRVSSAACRSRASRPGRGSCDRSACGTISASASSRLQEKRDRPFHRRGRLPRPAPGDQPIARRHDGNRLGALPTRPRPRPCDRSRQRGVALGRPAISGLEEDLHHRHRQPRLAARRRKLHFKEDAADDLSRGTGHPAGAVSFRNDGFAPPLRRSMIKPFS